MAKWLTILFLCSIFSSLYAQDNNSKPSANSNPMGISQEELENRISKKYSIPMRKITEYEESGVRLRDLMAAAALSKPSKKSIDSLFLMKQNFANWEDLAKSLKISPDVMFKAMEEIKNGKGLTKKTKTSKKPKPKA